MAKGGRKYRLLLYRHVLNRWWPATLFVALLLFLYVGVLWGAQWYFLDPAENPLPILSDRDGYLLIGAGGFALLITFLFWLARNGAYVQLFDTYLRIVTPFMRIHVAYKRIHRTVTAQVVDLFPPSKYKGTAREILEPLSNETALVVHLTAYPLPRRVLRLFLSPFFFYDKTPHFVFIVDDWMRFSIELDSRRTGGKPQAPRRPAGPRLGSGLLDELMRK
ncbi:MAG: hypothetical protein DDG60_09010 [Anaerolineae bacterium]|nr:MAG: hypothetical protein DDG60_09010 [Anaerolineae bacterium]